jgi:hypothetical protein
VAPPDTHIAAGINEIVEFVNSSESVWSKDGTLLQTFDLHQLFAVPTGYFISDPWVVFFRGSYYASAMAFDRHDNSQLYAAISNGGDPTSWTTYLVKQNTVSVLYDTPKLAVAYFTVTTGQMTLVWEDYDCGHAGCPFQGEEIWVADPVTGGLATWSYGPDANLFGSYPAQPPPGDTSGQYLLFNASDPDVFTLGPTPSLGFAWINGSPAYANTMALGKRLIPMTATHIPPDALQGGGGRPINTGLDLVLSAWAGSGLWIALADACTPPGDTAVRSCIRLLHVPSNQTIDREFDVSANGAYLFYPAITSAYTAPVNGFVSEYVYMVYNRSSASNFAGVFMNGFPADNPGGWLGEITVRAGTGTYDCSFCGPSNRWGDFSSAVADPGPWTPSYLPVRTDVWLAGEFAAGSRQSWGTSLARFTIAAPQSASVSPNQGPLSGGTPVTVTGDDFTPSGTTVSFGSVPATSVTVVSPHQLTATSPARVSAGAVPVTVTTPLGTSSSSATFTYLDAPVVTSVSPNTWTPGNPVVISGSHFNNYSRILFGGTPPGGIIGASDTQLSVWAPPHPGGTVDVTVTTPGGTSAATPADQFTYPTTQPTVTSVSPTSGSTGGGVTVAIRGTGLLGTSGVSFGGVPASSFTLGSDSYLEAIAPAGTVGTVHVTVTSGSNTSTTGAADQFTYVSVSITSMNPSTGPPGGALVSFTGTGFRTGAPGYTPSAMFGNTPSPLTVTSDTQATATAPPSGVFGAVPVKVCTTIGCSAPSTFTYGVSVTSISPSSGWTAGGASVVISGSGFNGTGPVKFGAIPATSYRVVSDNEIDATSPPEAAGTVPISVAAMPSSTSTAVLGQFTYVAPVPVVTSVDRVRSSSWGGALVTIKGTGFSFATQVAIGGVTSPALHVDSDTQVSTISPAHAPGVVDVTVTTAGGRSATGNQDHLTYSDCVMAFATDKTFPFGAPCTAPSNYQYGLSDSDGTTWEDIDPFNLMLLITPSVDSTYLLGGNADLWTVNPGFNQDLGIDVNGTIVAWKESGGFAGTFSPNAAFVQTVYPMTAGRTYVIRLKWKTNKADPKGVIVAAAGGGAPFSPTRLTATLIPNPSTSLATAVSNNQYRLNGSDGVHWKDIDQTALSTSLVAPADGVMVLGANADLWTVNAGFNQDLAINVNGSIAGWKESGGFAGTFSPNAAFLQTVYPVTAGQTYNVKLQWKTNKPDPGGVILAAAGLGPNFSPTRLNVQFFATGLTNKSVNNQYQLTGSDGASWKDIDTTGLGVQVTTTQNCLALVSGNVDLWTANAGFNQDVGLFISGGTYGAGQVVAWKESGGFAGTFSPNAAFVQTLVPLPPGTYTATLQWKSNKGDPGTIFAAAGLAPRFSPSAITIQLDCG